ncbi:unnamed protein product [Calypogeia fissa]
MRGLAAVVKGSIFLCSNNFANLTSRTTGSLQILSVRFNSVDRVMEAGKNVQSNNTQGSQSTSKKSYSPGNKDAVRKQVWAPKRQNSEPELKAAVAGDLDTISDVEVIESPQPPQEVVENKTVKSKLFAQAQVKATFYPKFENEKSDQEVRTKMIQLVSAGKGVVEVSLKHSGSLFLYSGDGTGGAFAKNSYGNLYTAVGVFVLGRLLKEAWGAKAPEKQREFNAYLQENHLSIAMELVTAVLGDHGQRPLQDFVVVTAVTELKGRPRFFSTADVVAFCHNWRLPTNQLWLFSKKKSVTAFFSAYDALCEEGIASSVTKVLDELADLAVPGTRSHTELQGEILEGLVARVVDPTSISNMETTLLQHPVPEKSDGSTDLGLGLREICAANRESEEKQIKALLQSVGSDMCSNVSEWLEEKSPVAEAQLLASFLQASPADNQTLKLQELCNAIRTKKLPVRFKCRANSHRKQGVVDDEDLKSFRMTIHVLSDSAFRRYQSEIRKQPGLWPLYRGFFVDVDLFHSKDNLSAATGDGLEEKLAELSVDEQKSQANTLNDTENLMLKLKFLPYKLRTFLIRNGLACLLNKGVAEYKSYYMRQMKNWGTSASKQKELVQLLDEWAIFAKVHIQDKKLHTSYLTVAEPFLEKYAQRSPKNQRLIGAAGSLVNIEQFLAIPLERSDDEEEFTAVEDDSTKISSATDQQSAKSVKAKGMLVFFPGIPGCAKSALCAEIRKVSEFGNQHHLMGDLTKGKYWQILADQRKKKPQAVTLADKNAPNEEVWKQIENICESSQAVGVPVIVDSPGTQSNPYSLDALAIFISRVLQRVEHPGKLDKNSPNPGAVLLMFYNLYNGKDRKEFEEELQDRFGHLVKMPLLKADREPLPTAVREVIEQGLALQKKHVSKHGRLESTKGTFKDAWATWEAQLRKTLSAHSKYLDSIQVPLQDSVKSVVEQLRTIITAGLTMHVPKVTEERTFNTFTFAAVKLPKGEVARALEKIVSENSEAQTYITGKSWKENLGKAHVTLAHKHAHGVAAVAAYGSLRGSPAPVQITSFVYSDKLCALEVLLNPGDEQTIKSLNSWPHVTVWTGQGMKPKDANALPALVDQGQAKRINFSTPFNITGTIDFV